MNAIAASTSPRTHSRFFALHQHRARLHEAGIIKSLSAPAALVLYALDDFADGTTGLLSCPSVTRLAAEHPYDERTIRRALRELEAKGLVTLVEGVGVELESSEARYVGT